MSASAETNGTDGTRQGRRRRGKEAKPRPVYQQITLTEAERERLRARAAELGVSVPRLLVESALEGLETPTERRQLIGELFEARRLLATVANNVNQLARSANISGQVAEREVLEPVLDEVRVLVLALQGVTGVRR